MWSVRRANCKRFTHIRPTDGIGPRTISWSVWRAAPNGGAWTDSRSTLGRFQSLGSLLFYFKFSLREWGSQNKQQNSTVTALKHSPGVLRLGPTASPQTHANVKRTGSFPDTAEEYAPDVSLQGRIPRRYALQFFLPSTAPCKSPRARVRRMALSAD